jgi:hypothetical protein
MSAILSVCVIPVLLCGMRRSPSTGRSPTRPRSLRRPLGGSAAAVSLAGDLGRRVAAGEAGPRASRSFAAEFLPPPLVCRFPCLARWRAGLRRPEQGVHDRVGHPQVALTAVVEPHRQRVQAHAVVVIGIAEAAGEHLPGERVVFIRRGERDERRRFAERARGRQPWLAVPRAVLVADGAGGWKAPAGRSRSAARSCPARRGASRRDRQPGRPRYAHRTVPPPGGTLRVPPICPVSAAQACRAALLSGPLISMWCRSSAGSGSRSCRG